MGDSAFPSRIDHVGMLVRNIDASAIDFVERLGMTLEIDEIVASVNVRLLYLRCADDDSPTYVQLVQPLGDGPLADHLRINGDGLHHVCFAVDDIPDLLDELGVTAETKVIIGGRSRRTCFLTGRVSGLLVELTENVTFEPQ